MNTEHLQLKPELESRCAIDADDSTFFGSP
jgi:hypothetical protein